MSPSPRQSSANTHWGLSAACPRSSQRPQQIVPASIKKQTWLQRYGMPLIWQTGHASSASAAPAPRALPAPMRKGPLALHITPSLREIPGQKFASASPAASSTRKKASRSHSLNGGITCDLCQIGSSDTSTSESL